MAFVVTLARGLPSRSGLLPSSIKSITTPTSSSLSSLSSSSRRLFHSSLYSSSKLVTPTSSTYTNSHRRTHIPSLLPLPPQHAQSFARRQYSDMAAPAEPTGLIAKEGIELLTMGTPNGVKISILLEELKEAYGKPYTYQAINIMKNTQKEPWFTAVNPNGRIPAIVDHDRNDFAVFEGMAILSYLTRHYDPEHKFSFPIDSDDYSVAEQWMAWQHGGLGPMQGQANHFYRFAKEKIPYGANRYVGEAERLYGILNTRLEGRDYLVGEGKGKYSIADMNTIGWVNGATMSGLDWDNEEKFGNVRAWADRVNARPAVQKGSQVPSGKPSPFSNANIKKTLAEADGEAKAKNEELKKFLKDAQEKYGYVYTTP